MQSSEFEPFGNFFFGFAMAYAGYSYEATNLIAGYVQEGNHPFLTDAPEDRPHVAASFFAAEQYRRDIAAGLPDTPITIIQD